MTLKDTRSHAWQQVQELLVQQGWIEEPRPAPESPSQPWSHELIVDTPIGLRTISLRLVATSWHGSLIGTLHEETGAPDARIDAVLLTIRTGPHNTCRRTRRIGVDAGRGIKARSFTRALLGLRDALLEEAEEQAAEREREQARDVARAKAAAVIEESLPGFDQPGALILLPGKAGEHARARVEAGGDGVVKLAFEGLTPGWAVALLNLVGARVDRGGE